MAGVTRGRLSTASSGPAEGEQAVEVARLAGGTRVEQILSGELPGPVDLQQDHEEWVVLLDGTAELEVDDERLDLRPGDWVLLPAGTPHRLVRTGVGTRWLAVHAQEEPSDGAA